MVVKFRSWKFSLEKDNLLSKQRELFFTCPICGEVIRMNKLSNGDTLLQWLIKEKPEEIESLELTHKKCGMKMAIAIKDVYGVETSVMQ